MTNDGDAREGGGRHGHQQRAVGHRRVRLGKVGLGSSNAVGMG